MAGAVASGKEPRCAPPRNPRSCRSQTSESHARATRSRSGSTSGSRSTRCRTRARRRTDASARHSIASCRSRRCSTPAQGVVTRLTEPTEREFREFEKLRIPLDNPEKTMRIDVSKVDPTTFNIVDYHLRSLALSSARGSFRATRWRRRSSTSAPRSRATSPVRSAISHCIPFQYVRDGCYARAHKMRQIIEEQYGYCSEKVFSFALDEGHARCAGE